MMARALQIAEHGRGIATPNPHVGCVIVKQGRIIGEGFTRLGGRPHAEAEALAACRGSPAGATAYSTLEPCAAHAKARGPACADLLVAANIKRVVSALHDPFHGVNGAGHERLRAAGIALDVGLMEAQAREQLKAFLARVERGRPWLTLKVAATLDGKTALSNGASQWITGPEARRDVHRLRAMACAVLTGIGTALVDDPALTVRDLPAGMAVERQPLRILLDSKLEVRDGMKLLQGGNTLIVTSAADSERAQALRAQGVAIMAVPKETIKGKVDLVAMLQQLGRYQERGMNHILVEAGAKLNASLLMAGVVDEIIFYVAPSLFGDSARGLFALPELTRLQDRINLAISDVRQVGKDLRITAQLQKN